MEKIGKKIRQYRLDRKLTQDDMASALNLSQRAYSKIENDEVHIKIDRLEEIAKILNVDISELLSSSTNYRIDHLNYGQVGNGKFVYQPNDKERELFEKIIARQQEEIEYLKGIINVFKK